MLEVLHGLVWVDFQLSPDLELGPDFERSHCCETISGFFYFFFADLDLWPEMQTRKGNLQLNVYIFNAFQAEGENEVNNELANRISLFYADATPMLKTLSDGTTKFVSEVRLTKQRALMNGYVRTFSHFLFLSSYRTRTCPSRTRRTVWARWRLCVKSCWKRREYRPALLELLQVLLSTFAYLNPRIFSGSTAADSPVRRRCLSACGWWSGSSSFTTTSIL